MEDPDYAISSPPSSPIAATSPMNFGSPASSPPPYLEEGEGGEEDDLINNTTTPTPLSNRQRIQMLNQQRATTTSPHRDSVSGSRTALVKYITDPSTIGMGETDAPGTMTDVHETFIWGTTINVESTIATLKTFFLLFTAPTPTPTSPSLSPSSPVLNLEPFYPRMFSQMRATENYNLNLDCENLHSFDPQLYNHLVRYPQEFLAILDIVIDNLFWGGDKDKTRIQVRNKLSSFLPSPLPSFLPSFLPPSLPSFLPLTPFHLPPSLPTQIRTFNLLLADQKPMRRLNPGDLDKMVSIRGMVTRTSEIIPDLRQAFFQCAACNDTQNVLVERGTVADPQGCNRCSARRCMKLVHNRCIFADRQLVKLQETPESVPEGETPHTVTVMAFDGLVDVSRPGDRVEVTGILRAAPVRVSRGQRTIRSVYRTYLDVLHFRRTDKGRMSAIDDNDTSSSVSDTLVNPEGEDAEFHAAFEEGDALDSALAEKEAKLRELANSPDIYDKLTRALAPSIWELDDVKKGILLQLFGGARKNFSSAGNAIGPRFRGEINVLLVGDPGTSKSQLLQYVHKIAPRGIYTSGKGASAVGLTAYVTKDPDTGQSVLESGALVLSDRGVCCIDEFDKMSDTTRSILHEAMEQQTVSVAKAGIICTLNARTSILASANPRESRYNPNMSVVDNIQLPPTLLSRFDLIYLVLDKPNEASDRRLARHLVSLYYEDPETRATEINTSTLTDYISYARKHIQPVITDESADDLVQGYLDMRRLGSTGGKKTITATTRQLESLIRLSEGTLFKILSLSSLCLPPLFCTPFDSSHSRSSSFFSPNFPKHTHGFVSLTRWRESM
jgi:DNA replication licensing factor MCM4